MSTYTVKHGDTLQSIAFKFFGDENMAQYLASINGIAGYPGSNGMFYVIYPNQVLNVSVASIEANRIWPWAIGAGILTVIIFRKKISKLFKKS